MMHAQAFGQLGSAVEVIGIADKELAKVEKLTEGNLRKAFGDYRELISLAPDVTVVCLPYALHREASILAASAGSHILVEKPFTASVADAREVIAACEKAGVHVGVGYVHRYRREFELAHEIIASGSLGQLLSANDRYGLSGDASVPEWVWRSGGTLLYSGVHSIDWLRWLVGSDVVEVFGSIGPGEGDTSEGKDPFRESAAAILRFANGCVATFIANQPAYEVSPRTRDTELYGTQGRIRLRLGEGLDVTTNQTAYQVHVTRDDPFTVQARDFIEAVNAQRTPSITGAEGVKVLEIVEAIRTSSAENRVVRISR
jgi:predicted dehydrogenase